MKTYLLNIGVSITDTIHYGNSFIPLPCCALDAKYMNSFSEIFNYDKSILLLNREATVENVKNEITKFSNVAKEGDLVIISYSGHGSRMPDINGDEKDGEDQTWCLYDRQIIDDEFRRLWIKFKKGVNILLIIDSCYSGTSYKSIDKNKDIELAIDYSRKYKTLSSKASIDVFQKNRDLYKPICGKPLVDESFVECYVTAITACQDDEEALAGNFISFFTRILISTLATDYNEIFNYSDLVERVSLKSKQLENITPNISHFGKPTDFFITSRPFLKKGEVYPEKISEIYSDLIFGKKTIINKGLQLNGLIVDITNLDDEGTKLFQETLKSTDRKALESIVNDKSSYLVSDTKFGKSMSHPWDKAYDLYDDLKSEGVLAYVEPDLIPFEDIDKAVVKARTENNEYIKNWPNPIGEDNIFTWHIDDEHSQLAKARDYLINNLHPDELNAKIGHIDTGYSPSHPAIPKNVLPGVSFVKGEVGKPAYEKPTSKLAEQEDHGTATMSILAGKEVSSSLGFGTGSMKLGAIPFATIYPIRISETVALTSLLGNATPFVRAVDKAIEEGCEVITMSMGGLPIRAWAKVVNKAYEAGVTIVSAAGNSWVKGFGKIAPKKILYPARFDRVIAATGVCYNHYPYVAKANPAFNVSKASGGEYMQGNFYPRKAMKTSIAAYTPNVPWAVFSDKEKKYPAILKNGGGTSSATPQVAAAAAMWITKNKQELKDKGYYGTWKQVEAVKYALFNSAKKNSILEWEKYFGNGILKAHNALLIDVPDESLLKIAKKARVTLGLFNFIEVVILRKSSGLVEEDYDENKAEMIMQEIVQVMEQDPVLIERYSDIDLIELDENNSITEEQFREICKQVAASPYSSEYLKSILF